MSDPTTRPSQSLTLTTEPDNRTLRITRRDGVLLDRGKFANGDAVAEAIGELQIILEDFQDSCVECHGDQHLPDSDLCQECTEAHLAELADFEREHSHAALNPPAANGGLA